MGVALIAYGWGWYEADIVHFEDDEPARHRIIDLTVRLSTFRQKPAVSMHPLTACGWG